MRYLLVIINLSLCFFAVGCTAEQLARTQQTGADIAAGKTVYVQIPTTQPGSPATLAIPSDGIPYHQLVGDAIILGAMIVGAFTYKHGVNQGQDTQTLPGAVPVTK